MKRISLHADIVSILEENENRWMAPDILAMAVNSRRLFRQDPRTATAREVISRVTVKEHRGSFERKGTFIRLAGRGQRVKREL